MHSRSPRWFCRRSDSFGCSIDGATSRPALAHAVLVSSTPQKNAAVSGPDITINLKYNSRVDGARSTLSLLKPDGTVERIGAPAQPAPDVLIGNRPRAREGSLRASLASSGE